MATEAPHQDRALVRRKSHLAMTTRGSISTLALMVGAYLLILFWQVGPLLQRASWNADNSNMLNLSHDLFSLSDGEVINMGNAPIYSTLWSNATLDRLGGSAKLIEAVPLVWYLASAALVAFGVRRATDSPFAKCRILLKRQSAACR